MRLVCTFLMLASSLLAGVRVQVVRGRPVVDGVFVNGHGPYRFLVDTATTANHLESALARSIGLEPTFRTELTSSVGLIVVPGSNGIEVALGDARADAQTFLFAGMDLAHRVSPSIQGILGQAFLSRFDYLLDLHARLLEFGTLEPAGNRTRVPFHILNGRPVVSTSLGELAVDSGVDWITLFGIRSRGEGGEMNTMSGSVEVGMVSRKLRIDGRTYWQGDVVAIARADEADVAGLLPVKVFHSVYFCNSAGYVVFE
jgi:hypothetical protein